MKNIWKLLMIALLAFAMIGCPTTKEDDDDDNGGSGVPAISWWESSNETTPGTPAKAKNFPYGFKFTTKAGWSSQYVASSHVAKGATFTKVTLDPTTTTSSKFNGPYDTMSADSSLFDGFNDDSTKLYIDEDALTPGQKYTLTFTTTNFDAVNALPDTEVESTVTLSAAAAGAEVTDLATDQTNDAADEIYISGGKGGNAWAGTDAIGGAQKLVKGEGSYTFTWAAPMTTVKVTLKIDVTTDTTLYLTNVPVKQDGTTVVNGSIYEWNGGTPVTIAKKAGEDAIAGGIYDAAATAENPSWALDNFTGAEHTLADLHAEGAADVLQLSIEGTEAWVPYVLGATKTFSWTRAIAK